MSTARYIPFTLAELCKAKSIKFVRIFKDPFICMSSPEWEGDESACGDSDTIGKCERTQHETGHDSWGKDGHVYE